MCLYEIRHDQNLQYLSIVYSKRTSNTLFADKLFDSELLGVTAMLSNIVKTGVLLLITIALTSCTSLPKGVTPVENFDLDQYLGKWYEIARLDHRFERGLSEVSAEYSLLDNGDVRVLNSGYSQSKQESNTAEGTAKFVESSSTGHLKVSFFGPLYGSYVVFELDDDYEYAFVSGFNKKYLWLLARSSKPDPKVIDLFKVRASELGFPVEELIWVEHKQSQ